MLRKASPGGMLRLGQIGFANRLRGVRQRFLEARLLEELGLGLDDGVAVEIGCGAGFGLEIILERFNADKVVGFDVDPYMLEKARDRVASMRGRAQLLAGDSLNIPLRDGSVDAVFDFVVIHMMPDWRHAVTEVSRVLKPGGRFYFEELAPGFRRRLGKIVGTAEWPPDRFDRRAFVSELNRRDLYLQSYADRFGLMFGVARRLAESDLPADFPPQ